jgi:hypothetical protein
MNQVIYKKKLNNSIVNISFFTSLLLFFYLFIDLLRQFNIIPLVGGNVLYIVLGGISIIYTISKKGIKKQVPILLFIFVYNLFGALGVIFNGNIDIQELLWPIGFMGLATLLLNFDISYKTTKYLYVFLLLFLTLNILTSGDINNLDMVSSRNTINIMVLSYFSIFIITCYRHQKKINIYYLLAGFIVVLMSVGRSGILTFLLLTLFFLFFDFNGQRHRIRNLLKFLMILIFVSIVLFVLYNLFSNYFNNALYNFDRRGFESIRTEIWSDYIDKVFSSVKYLIFGAPISGTVFLDMFPNLHNSWLMLHSKYGLVVFLIVILLVLRSYTFFLKTKNYLFLALLTAIMFRMQFDHTNFNAQLDIALFYFLMYPYMYTSANNSVQKKPV